VKPFLGFADDQMKRLLGQKGQKNVHRAELEDKHGYDTKYAMHVASFSTVTGRHSIG
jgi:hypothetical protein